MKLKRQMVLALLACSASTASLAHTGHAGDSLFAGLTHPLAVDHLLAMVAVGVWAAAALPAGRRAQAAAVFMAGLLGGAVAGVAGDGFGAWLDIGVALSLAVFGALLLAPRALPLGASLALVAAAATLHGLAHGAEWPAAGGFGAYAIGFLGASAALQASGVALGGAMLHAQRWVWRAAAAALGGAALWMTALA